MMSTKNATHTIFDEWRWRGMHYDSTDGAAELLGREKVTVYNGFDPTADSLHIGHLVPIIGLARLQRFGHHPIAVAGGGTGMVGDPSGRSTERNLLSAEQIAYNVECIQVQIAPILDFEVKTNPARIVNNADWLGKLTVIDFLRDIGKHFTVNYMLAKDSVKSRLDREDGLSYTEFSYMLMQAYDFLHLFDHFGCVMQTGGSDQWGNITAGVSLIRRMRTATAHGVVYPLITRDDGTKFGKTADGDSVWLDPARTSPYRFYQFLINTDDDKVVEMLKLYTFLTEDVVVDLAHKVETEPHRREAQQALAREVTRMVHGETGLASAERATDVLFGGSLEGLTADDVADIFAEVPSSDVTLAELEGDGMALADLLATTTLASSKGDAKRALKGGGIYVNNSRPERQTVTVADAMEGRFIVLRKGRRRYHLVRVRR